MTLQCAICRDVLDPPAASEGALCAICQEERLKVAHYGFVTPRLEAIALKGGPVTLRCKQCGYPYETDAADVTLQRPVCPDCWRDALVSRTERQRLNDDTYRRAVRREFEKRSA